MTELDPVEQIKIKARVEVHTAIRHGILTRPDKCQQCGVSCKPDAHHHAGYEIGNRLNVVWLCKKCHFKLHHQNNRIHNEFSKIPHNEFRPIPEKENITKPRGMQHCKECHRWFSTFGHFLRHLYTQHKQIVVK